jgi:molybdenum cofactor cytidylyltransferase
MARLAILALEGGSGRGATLTPVPVPGEGDMLESVRAGFVAAGEAAGALVWPVDTPCTARATVLSVLGGAREQPLRVVRPVHAGQPGHPIWVPAGVLAAAHPTGAAPGLRGLIDALAPDPLDLQVIDPGCLVNLNTPEAYEAALRRGA